MVTDRRKKAQIVIGLVFLLGAIIGGLAVHLLYRQKPQPNNSVIDITDELTLKVGLDSFQQSRVLEALTESRKQRNELYLQIQPQLTAVRDSTRTKIREILTLEQLIRYDQWIQEMDAKHQLKSTTK